MLSGGVNKWSLYRVHDDGTQYIIQLADGSGAAVDTTSAVITLTKLEQAKLTPQTDGSLKGVFDQYDDTQSFDTFLKEWATPASGTTAKEIKFIDGSSSNSSSSDDCLLMICYGPKDPSNTNKRKCRVFLADVSKDSGDETYKDGEYIKPSLTITTRKTAYALTIPEALFDGAAVKVGVGGIGPQTLAIETHHDRLWLATE